VDLVRKELADDATVDITTIGRRSGEPRRIEIWMFDFDGRFFITGVPGRRAWLANIKANPAITVHLKRIAHTDVQGRATVVTDPDTRRFVIERRRPILQQHFPDWASTQDDAELIAGAPMIEVVFESADPA
jgi:deazaflavin-dependent oxidoreductase (nitroreductase family)